MFPKLDFSQIQIKVTTLTTLVAEPILEDVETDEDLVVTDGPGGVADNPMNPSVQNNDPPASP